MPYISRDSNGNINGLFSVPQFQGQEFSDDNSMKLYYAPPVNNLVTPPVPSAPSPPVADPNITYDAATGKSGVPAYADLLQRIKNKMAGGLSQPQANQNQTNNQWQNGNIDMLSSYGAQAPQLQFNFDPTSDYAALSNYFANYQNNLQPNQTPTGQQGQATQPYLAPTATTQQPRQPINTLPQVNYPGKNNPFANIFGNVQRGETGQHIFSKLFNKRGGA
jgi:hypothetical protein